MLDGEIQSLVAEKGFGFIKPAAGGADVFFHFSAVDAPFESLTQGQRVKYDLDSQAEKPRAQVVQTGAAPAKAGTTQPNTRPSSKGRPGQNRQTSDRRTSDRRTTDRRTTDRRTTDRRAPDLPAFEHGFVTKLHRKKFRGFISSIKHGPEFVFAAASVTGDKRYSRLEIGDYVQFLIGEPDPDEPKQPVAKAVQVVEREVKIPNEKRLGRHPNARKKKPTWR